MLSSCRWPIEAMAIMAATVFVPRERASGEERIALVPTLVARYGDLGLRVLIEKNAGKAAGFPDAAFEGAEIVAEPAFDEADVVLTVRRLAADAIGQLRRGAAVVGLLAPHEADFPAAVYAEAGALAFALEKLPRISRAQSMDALSSQAAARATGPSCLPHSNCRVSFRCSRLPPVPYDQRGCS